MVFGSTDALTSRERFVWKPLVDMAFAGGACIGGVILLSLACSFLPNPWIPMLLGDGVALLGTYYYLQTLTRKPILLTCDNTGCHKVISSRTPWVCCVCDHINRHSAFVDRCENEACRFEPKTYKCHHCDGLIFLTPDRDKQHAVRALKPEGGSPSKDNQALRDEQRAQEKADKNHELDIAKIEDEMQEIRRRIQGPKVVLPAERILAQCKTAYEELMVSETWCDEMEKEARKKFTGDRLEKELSAIRGIAARFS